MTGNDYFSLSAVDGETDTFDVIFIKNSKRIGSMYREVDGDYVFLADVVGYFMSEDCLYYLHKLLEEHNGLERK